VNLDSAYDVFGSSTIREVVARFLRREQPGKEITLPIAFQKTDVESPVTATRGDTNLFVPHQDVPPVGRDAIEEQGPAIAFDITEANIQLVAAGFHLHQRAEALIADSGEGLERQWFGGDRGHP